MTRSSRHDRRRNGFTLIEMSVVCFMSALMASLMAGAWAAFGRSAVDVDARCRIAQEASLAAETLARDLSGYLPGSNAVVGGETSGKWSNASWDESSLSLTFGTGPDTKIITYQFVAPSSTTTSPPYGVPGYLTRTDQNGTTTTVACYLTNFVVGDERPGSLSTAGNVPIQFTISYRNFQRTYHLIGVMMP